MQKIVDHAHPTIRVRKQCATRWRCGSCRFAMTLPIFATLTTLTSLALFSLFASFDVEQRARQVRDSEVVGVAARPLG